MQLNIYFPFFCFFLIINLFMKVELEHANRPSSSEGTFKVSLESDQAS